MFALRTKTRYSLSAIMEMARHYGDGLLQVKDIAGRHAISQQYLEQLLNRLIHAGLVRAVRGKNGGYTLANPPEQTTLIALLEALDGPLEFSASYPAEDALKDLCRQAEEQFRKALDIPLSEVLKRQEEFDRQFVFYI
ncbi:MAG: Rrf2 family transcriptional regulator [Acidobacteriota bacterium]|nr:Rrf2 family transcriptional regulator [Acidobacteriota bacterium]